MTDLVKRLRCYNPPDRTVDEQRQIAQDIYDAADEIERLNARVAELEQDRDAWMLLAKAKHLPMDECPVHCETGRKLSARIAELETKLTEEAAAWESAARIDAVIEGKGR